MEKVFTHLRFKLDRTQKKVIFYILGITLPLFFFSLYFIQNTAGKELTKFAEEKAFHLETRIISEIKHYLDNASSFTKEASYMLKLDPAKYTTLLPFLKKHLQNNPNIYGSALAIEPDSYLNKTYCKYYYKHNGALKEKWLMPPHYDYLHQEWYSKVKQLKKGMWSKPYFDEGGGEVFMSTFTYPLLDSHQTFLGVVTADIKIDILSEKIQKMTFSKEHFVFVLDKSGFLLSHPDSHYALKQTAFAYAKNLHSKTLSNALQQMLSADKGKYTVTIASQTYTLYSVDVPNSDLKIAVFLNNTALFRPLNELKQKLGIVTFIGIILLLLLIVVILREFKQDIIKKTKLKHEFELATKIQMSFLPKKKNMQTDRYEIHSYLKAAREVGGDLYGYKESGNNIVLYVGDVSGKGIPAALFMMATQILLKNTIETTSDPAEIVTLINKRLLETSQNGMFVTLLVIRYDFINQVLTFCNAGHPPFIIKADQLFSPLPTLHPPVNTFENTVYTNNRLTIKTPFQLICFSDGVTEAVAKIALYKASAKLPIKTKFIKRV
jgi:sigma-B regulation protein RsbU (phosphoserine phosphatase)